MLDLQFLEFYHPNSSDNFQCTLGQTLWPFFAYILESILVPKPIKHAVNGFMNLRYS